MLPETMWCLRLLLLVVLLPWSSSVKRGRTPAGTPLISTCFPQLSSAPADAVSSATPTSPLPPCRLIEGHVGENVRLLLPFALCKMFFLTTRIPTAHTHPSCHPPRRPRLQYRTSLGTNFADRQGLSQPRSSSDGAPAERGPDHGPIDGNEEPKCWR